MRTERSIEHGETKVQAPIATGQQAEPQQTPPAAAGEPAGGLGEKEGVNNAD